MGAKSDTYSTLFEVIRSRRSVRQYTEQPIGLDTIHRLLEVARWAPSAHNRQPWRFVVVADASARQVLGIAMADQLRRQLRLDGVDEQAIARDASRSVERIAGAGVVIVVCLTMEDMDAYPDEARQQRETLMAVQSVAMAGQNLLLAAHALGLGACWMCAPLFAQATVQDVLGLPPEWQPQGLITLGYPLGTPEKTRAPMIEKVLWR
jgi:coenzyme F420-0:L-glutamate ligase / coenzyme F420-1:gamma-L-glutamate ligase